MNLRIETMNIWKAGEVERYFQDSTGPVFWIPTNQVEGEMKISGEGKMSKI